MGKFLLLSFCLFLFFLSRGVHEAAATQPTFCTRAISSRTCPTPPTVDTINLQAYLGRWYEIGSTASFKLLTEAGLACNQALYSSQSGNLTLLNSGTRVVGTLATAEVGALSLSARGVCSGARQICYQTSTITQALGQIADAAHALTALGHVADANSLSQAGEKLKGSMAAAEKAIQAVADDVSGIQEANGQISQGNGNLAASVDAIQGYVGEARKEEGSAVDFVGDLNKVSYQVKGISKKLSKKGNEGKVKEELDNVSAALSSAALKVAASNAAISVGLKAIDASASALRLDGQPIDNGKVSSVNGGISIPNPSSQGKLEVNINGAKAPYWIIALEDDYKGGYKAALVYSCNEVSGVLAKSLFILSREPQLDHAIIDKFLTRAYSFGIYNDCDDPFLFTIQKGGDCGRPTS